MNHPLRTTIVYAVLSGLVVAPAAWALSIYLYWPTAFKLMLWADLALYGALMARWSRVRLPALLFPLAILLGSALWPRTYSSFFILALGVFAWMRSGICFQGAPLRALSAEVLTLGGTAGLLLFFGGHSPVAWALTICLFFLIQSLYFFIVPARRSASKPRSGKDPFEKAVEEATKVLDGI
ncbi:MAG: hypothetical protein P8010_09475 [Desulfosarcinaceae bacterium]|jgi:hypothetical protein